MPANDPKRTSAADSKPGRLPCVLLATGRGRDLPSARRTLKMILSRFAAAITAAFIVGSLISLNYGRQLTLRYRQPARRRAHRRLPSVERRGICALIGLRIAFTVVRTHLHRDHGPAIRHSSTANVRRARAYDRRDLLKAMFAISSKRLRGCRCPDRALPLAADFSPRDGAEVWSQEQRSTIQVLTAELLNSAIAVVAQHQFFNLACPPAVSGARQVLDIARPACWRRPAKHRLASSMDAVRSRGSAAIARCALVMAAAKSRRGSICVRLSRRSLAATIYVIPPGMSARRRHGPKR